MLRVTSIEFRGGYAMARLNEQTGQQWLSVRMGEASGWQEAKAALAFVEHHADHARISSVSVTHETAYVPLTQVGYEWLRRQAA